MHSGRRRIWVIKGAVIGFFAFLFLVIVSILMWYGIIRFAWSDRVIVKYKYEKSKTKSKRILVLGDSQLEEWPMKHCLYRDMEKFCRANEIGYVNAAHYGFGPIEYRDRLEYIASDYKPTLILLFYYVGNDLTDVMLRNDEVPKIPTHDVVFIEGKADSQKLGKRVSPDFDWNSSKYKDIDSSIIALAKNKAMNPHILEMAVWQPGYLIDNNTVSTYRSKAAWYKVLKLLEDILTRSEEVNSAFCLIAIPSIVQVDSSHFNFYRKASFIVSNELLSSRKPQELLSDFSTASSIQYLDLLPFFKRYPNTSELYFENDDHLSEAGHKLAFNLVKEHILAPYATAGENHESGLREKDYYKNYYHWVIENKIDEIRNDSNWFNHIKKKAGTRSISVDSMLYIDAKYMLEK